MGISIDVESIVTPEERRFGPPQSREFQWARVHLLCEAFGWSKVPWQEPSSLTGSMNTSCNASKYICLLAVARAEARRERLKSLERELQTPISAVELNRFPQLLQRTQWTNYYLPVNFVKPIVIEDEKAGDKLSVGSSARLEAELNQIKEAMEFYLKQYDELTRVEEGSETGRHTWGDVNELCHTLLISAQESQALNLPLLLRG